MRQLEHALGERVKELQTITAVAQLTQQALAREELLAHVAGRLRDGMQWPEVVVVVLRIDTATTSLGGTEDELVERLDAPVVVGGRQRGQVTVGHREHRGFLEPYEQRLVDAIAGILASWQDRLDTTDALEIRDQRLHGLFQHALDAIFLLDDADRFVDVNPAACDLTGYDHQDLVGMRPIDLTPLEAQNALRSAVEDLHAHGSATGEFLLLRRDGGRVPVEYRTVADIAPGTCLAIVRDVSARRQAEHALRQSEERFRRIAENAQDVIFRLRLGDDAGFEYVSPAVQTLLGYTPSELYQDPGMIEQLVHPADQERLADVLGQRSELPSPLRLRWRHRDGSEVWVEQRHSYVYGPDGAPVVVEGIVRDIGDRVRTEEGLRLALDREREATDRLRRVDDMKNTFLSAVSHELRTPLTSLLGFSTLLERTYDRLPPARVTELLGRLARNAERLDALLEDLLDVDRLTRGRVGVDARPADLAALTLATLEQVDTTDHDLRVEVEPVVVPLDAPKVERIIENLVTNAVRHTDPGTPIWVRCGPDADGALLVVEDAGPGVAPDQREGLFEPFQLGESAAKVGGSGLGLTIVARLAELHGGRAWVDDREGGGAAFYVWLPDASGGSVTTTS